MACPCQNIVIPTISNSLGNCDPCNQITPCIELNCACPILIKSDCVNNVTVDMPYTGILKGKTLNEWILALDAFLNAKFLALQAYFTLKNVGVGLGKIYKGVSIIGEKEIKSIKAGNLVVITNLPDEVEVAVDNTALTNFVNGLEKTSSISNLGIVGAKVYNEAPIVLGNNTDYKVRRIVTTNSGLSGESILKTEIENINDITISAKKINSNDFVITSTADTININAPITFQGLGYYVNGNYTGIEELGTMSKPFKALQKCIDKILNRGSQNDGGAIKNKWDNLPKTKVYIQSYQGHIENLAINNVTWYLDGKDKDATIFTNFNLEYNIDMQELVTNCPKTLGKLNYPLSCTVDGQGTVINNSPNRKGYFNAVGFSDGISFVQPESNLYVGSKNSDIDLTMRLKSSLTYVPLTNKLGVPIVRENSAMQGLLDTVVPQYGAFSINNKNLPYGYSLILAGNMSIGVFEQPLFFADKGAIYSQDVNIFYQRIYRMVNFSGIKLINTSNGDSTSDLTGNTNIVDKNGTDVTASYSGSFFSNTNVTKFYVPSKKVSDIYLKNGSSMSTSGNIFSQKNTGMNQGGLEAFITLVRNSYIQINGLSLIGLLFNHFVKLVNSPNQSTTDPSDLFNQSQVSITDGNFNSQCFEELISCEEQDLSDNIIINTTRTYYSIQFFNSTLFNRFFNIYNKLSNLILNSRLFIVGDPIRIDKTFLYPQIPIYANNTLANVDLPIGSEYATSTGEKRIVY